MEDNLYAHANELLRVSHVFTTVRKMVSSHTLLILALHTYIQLYG